MSQPVFPLEQVGPHESALRAAIEQFDFPAGAEAEGEPVTIMLFTNRSVSARWAEYLRATGRVRGMGEPLNQSLVLSLMKRDGLDTFHDYLKSRVERNRTNNSMFGFTASQQPVMMVIRAGMIPGYFQDVRWVVVQRHDIIAQAVSFEIASQTKRWESFADQTEIQPRYDFEAIRQKVRALSLQNASINAFFSVQGIQPCRVNYEQFCANPIAATLELASSLGVDNVEVDPSKLRRHQQRDATGADFHQRFLKEYRGWLMAGDSRG